MLAIFRQMWEAFRNADPATLAELEKEFYFTTL